MPDDKLAFLDKKDKHGRTMRDYNAVANTFSKEFRDYVREVIVEMTDSALTLHGDVKGYASTVALADNVVDGVLLYIISDGYVRLAKKAKATPEETEKRRVEWEQSFQERFGPSGNGSALRVNGSHVGTYL